MEPGLDVCRSWRRLDYLSDAGHAAPLELAANARLGRQLALERHGPLAWKAADALATLAGLSLIHRVHDNAFLCQSRADLVRGRFVRPRGDVLSRGLVRALAIAEASASVARRRCPNRRADPGAQRTKCSGPNAEDAP